MSTGSRSALDVKVVLFKALSRVSLREPINETSCFSGWGEKINRKKKRK